MQPVPSINITRLRLGLGDDEDSLRGEVWMTKASRASKLLARSMASLANCA